MVAKRPKSARFSQRQTLSEWEKCAEISAVRFSDTSLAVCRSLFVRLCYKKVPFVRWGRDFVPATQPQMQAWEHRFWEHIMGTEFRGSGAFIGPPQHVPTNQRLRDPFKAGRKAAPRIRAPPSRPSARQLHDGRWANRGAGTNLPRTPRRSAFLIRPN